MNVIVEFTKLGHDVKIWHYCVIYDSTIGNNVNVGSFTEIGKAKIGNNTRIGMGCFICEGVTIGNNCFIGPRTCFTNDKYPSIKERQNAKLHNTVIEDGVSVGANCTILPGITLGKNCLIGGGSVVTRNVPPNQTWCGNPARRIK